MVFASCVDKHIIIEQLQGACQAALCAQVYMGISKGKTRVAIKEVRVARGKEGVREMKQLQEV